LISAVDFMTIDRLRYAAQEDEIDANEIEVGSRWCHYEGSDDS